MRIISGKHKGRKFYPPKHLPYRPTTDFAKTALFNILANYFDFEAIHVLDLFSGTGSISLEFASRGCTRLTSVDKNSGCVDFLKMTAEQLKLEGIHAYRDDVFRFLRNCHNKYDVIFSGPPYAIQNIPEIHTLVFEKNILNINGWLIIEHHAKLSLDHLPNLIDKRNYGTTIFSIFTQK